MTIESIEKDFKRKVCDQIRLEAEGLNRYRVLTPFMFGDGDHLAVVLRRENNGWMLSDEGHTYMHLTYSIDEASLQKGTRLKIIDGMASRPRCTCDGRAAISRSTSSHLCNPLISILNRLGTQAPESRSPMLIS